MNLMTGFFFSAAKTAFARSIHVRASPEPMLNRPFAFGVAARCSVIATQSLT